MRIDRVAFGAPGDHIQGFYQAFEAARGTDEPGGPPMSERHFRAKMEFGWSKEPGETWIDGERRGGYTLQFPEHDNTHGALLQVLVVHPDHRRNGVGRALLEHAIERARRQDRRLLFAESRDDSPGEQFAKATGFLAASQVTRRILEMADHHHEADEVLGYALHKWIGPTEDPVLDDMATLINGMNDAPVDALSYEDERWDAARVRAHDEAITAGDLDIYTIIARHQSSGEPAGYSRVFVENQDRTWGRQSDTAVLRGHRGHRLGMLLKVRMLEWLREREPAMLRIITWNADSNRHMLAVNERLGFRVLDRWHEWQKEI